MNIQDKYVPTSGIDIDRTTCTESDATMQPKNPLLIQILAQLKPRQCGVSDHAISLAEQLQSNFGIDSAFVIVNSTEPCEIAARKVYCSPSDLLEACESLSGNCRSAVLTQLSGYGFSRDGAPVALANALKHVRESGKFRMGAYFHELFVNEKRPWKSAFWYSRRQQEAILNVARICDMVVTNTNHHADWIERSLAGASIPVLRMPVSSNIGETSSLFPMCDRQPVMTVFGLPRTRKMSYRHLSRMSEIISHLGIKEVIDVGPECDAPTSIVGVPVKRMGILSPPDVASLLSRSMFGFSQHEPFCLAKSGVFAGLCAFGTVPLIAEPFSRDFDGLRDGVQLMSPHTWRKVKEGGLQRCSTAAWRWYANHNLLAHASIYADLLISSSVSSLPHALQRQEQG